jgi:hypothetical protein
MIRQRYSSSDTDREVYSPDHYYSCLDVRMLMGSKRRCRLSISSQGLKAQISYTATLKRKFAAWHGRT